MELRQRPDGGPLAVLTQASSDNDYGPRTGRLHLFDPATGGTVELGAAGADARSLAWWPGEDGWHLGYVALTPPVLQAGTAVFELTVDGPVDDSVLADVRDIAQTLLSNGVIEDVVAIRTEDEQ